MRLSRLAYLVALLAFVTLQDSAAQDMPLRPVLITSTPILKEGVEASAYEAFVMNVLSPSLNAPGAELHLFRADRGERTGELLLAWTIAGAGEGADAVVDGTFTDAHAELIGGRGSAAKYTLVAADAAGDLPRVEILGIHNVQVIPERREAFEAFVRDTLYQAIAGLTPGMHLLYYRGIGGDYPTNYVLLFGIETTAVREQYWPTGAPETEALSAAFGALRSEARSLRGYLVEGSFLQPETGAAAAIFESLDWNDYVHVGAAPR